MKFLCTALVVSAMFLPTLASAETSHGHRDGMTHTADTLSSKTATHDAIPTTSEPGQAAFAAIAEIVTMLRNDPSTNWSQVNISALRDHLSDMDRLVLETETTSTSIPGGLAIEVSFANSGGAAARRMVRAHAPVLAGETSWQSSVSDETDRGLIWTVVASEDEAQIRALGFYGLMATGSHHQTHHLGIARGEMRH